MNTIANINDNLNSDRMQWVGLFQQANISYCILRDITSCIEGCTPLEIDILIDHHQLPAVHEILFRNGYLLRPNKMEYPHFHFYLYKTTGLASILDIIIDLRVGKSGKIIKTLNPQSVLLNCKSVKGIKVISEDDEFVQLLLHSFVDKEVMFEKHKLRLRELLHTIKCKDNVEHKLSSLIRNKITEKKIFEFLAEDDDKNFLDIKHNLIKVLFFNASFTEKKNMILYLLYLYGYPRLNNLFKIRTKCRLVSLIGIDGAGKTTFIDEYVRSTSSSKNIVPCRLGYGAFRKYYFELTYVLCPIDLNVRQERIKKNKETRKNLYSRFWIYSNRCINYALNIQPFGQYIRPYVIEVLFYLEDLISIKKCARRAGNKGVVLTDRFAIERIVYLISQKKNIPWIFHILYTMIYPEIDLILFLDCGAETAVKRKGEMTIDEAINVNESYIYTLMNYYTIPSIRLDTNSSLNGLVKTVNFIR